MAELNYRCLGCAGAIFPNLTKTGKVSNHPRKYCSVGCKPGRVRQRTPYKPKLVVCQHCFIEKHRRVRGGSSDAGKYCSRACAFGAKARVSKEREAIRRIAALNLPSRHEALGAGVVALEIAALHRISSYIAVPMMYLAECRQCQAKFVVKRSRRAGGKRSVCDGCHRKAKAAYRFTANGAALRRKVKAKRRAVERGTLAECIDPIEVFDRDGWRCHMCLKPTPKGLRGTYDAMAPELDHIITLAEGGTHTWGNVACSCRSCNLAKGSRSTGRALLQMGPQGPGGTDFFETP